MAPRRFCFFACILTAKLDKFPLARAAQFLLGFRLVFAWFDRVHRQSAYDVSRIKTFSHSLNHLQAFIEAR